MIKTFLKCCKDTETLIQLSGVGLGAFVAYGYLADYKDQPSKTGENIKNMVQTVKKINNYFYPNSTEKPTLAPSEIDTGTDDVAPSPFSSFFNNLKHNVFNAQNLGVLSFFTAGGVTFYYLRFALRNFFTLMDQINSGNFNINDMINTVQNDHFYTLNELNMTPEIIQEYLKYLGLANVNKEVALRTMADQINKFKDEFINALKQLKTIPRDTKNENIIKLRNELNFLPKRRIFLDENILKITEVTDEKPKALPPPTPRDLNIEVVDLLEKIFEKVPVLVSNIEKAEELSKEEGKEEKEEVPDIQPPSEEEIIKNISERFKQLCQRDKKIVNKINIQKFKENINNKNAEIKKRNEEILQNIINQENRTTIEQMYDTLKLKRKIIIEELNTLITNGYLFNFELSEYEIFPPLNQAYYASSYAFFGQSRSNIFSAGRNSAIRFNNQIKRLIGFLLYNNKDIIDNETFDSLYNKYKFVYNITDEQIDEYMSGNISYRGLFQYMPNINDQYIVQINKLNISQKNKRILIAKIQSLQKIFTILKELLHGFNAYLLEMKKQGKLN